MIVTHGLRDLCDSLLSSLLSPPSLLSHPLRSHLLIGQQQESLHFQFIQAMEGPNKRRKKSLSHLIDSTKFLEPLAWAPRADTCPWLYSQASLPRQPFRAGLRTVHTQVLCFDGSLEAPSDFSVFPLLCSPGERGQAESLDPHSAGVSYPVPLTASRAPGDVMLKPERRHPVCRLS